MLYGLHRTVTANIAALRNRSKGTKIAIVGPPASGKTVIYRFLGTGVLVQEYIPTEAGVRVNATTVELVAAKSAIDKNPILLNLSNTIDVSGDYKLHSYVWQTALTDAFLVLFVFDASKFIAAGSEGSAYRRTVVDGCDFAGGLIAHNDTRVVMVGTHCDLIAGWTPKPTGSNMVNRIFWHDYGIDADDARTHLAKNTSNDAEVFFGSLFDEESAKDLLYQTFQALV
ncbi:MAG: Rab family GTPase [Streptosporangiaceae bacterium]